MAKWFLSPSSQEKNIGLLGYVEEKGMNKIADSLQAALIGQETMRNNPNEKYNQHTARSNAWGAKYHIVPHSNANANPAKRGLTMLCKDPANKTSLGTILAQNIYNELAAIYPGPCYGLRKDTFDELTNTHAAAAYPEIGYHTNLEDVQWLMTNYLQIGKAIAIGCLKTEGTIKPQTVQEVDMLTKGQIHEDVRAVQNALNKLGFPVGKADSEYGDLTEKGIVEFKKKHSNNIDGSFWNHDDMTALVNVLWQRPDTIITAPDAGLQAQLDGAIQMLDTSRKDLAEIAAIANKTK